jgi:Holliday junction resolvase
VPNSNRARGDYLEHQTRDALAQYGWQVTRAAGSMGAADLVCLRAGKRPLLVQCKILGPGRSMPRIDPAERMALYECAQKAGARAIIATRYIGGVITLMELPGPHWTRYPLVDELRVPARPGKGKDNAEEKGRLDSSSHVVPVPGV